MNTDFAMEDWDLEAVVRGFTNGSPTTINNNIESYPPKWFIPLSTQQDQDHQDHDLLFTTTFPEFFETTTVLDELEQLYKPFFPILNPISPPTILTTTSISVPKEEKEKEKEKEREHEKVQEKQSLASSANIVAPAKHKRRKNQQKRVVIQVTAEGLSADMWAWRKYGQKPIKGSPYPRSYYRCSSLKGCLARKQVERSNLDPEMFIVTYTAEHSHTKPTRRSSLAGTTRHKSPTSTGGDRLIVTAPTSTAKDCSCSPISGASSLSPTTPSLSATIEDDHYFLQADEAMKNESKVDINEEQIVQDMILSEDFFSGLDFELDGLASDHVAFAHCFPADQFNFQMSFPC